MKAISLDAVTGKEIWRFDPFGVTGGRARDVNRGVSYWESADKKDRRILYPVAKRLWALDAKTGKPIPTFGENGSVDLTKELDREALPDFGGSTSPGAIYKDLIILGSHLGEGPRPASP